MNLPNAITLTRIVATPFFLWLLLAVGTDPVPRLYTFIFFTAAITTDAFDGHLARTRGQVTALGKLLDPIADKFLTGAALVGLTIIDELPWWVTALILAREIGITVHRLIISNRTVIAAAWLGKIKTAVQALAIGFALAPTQTLLAADVAHASNTTLMTLATALTLISGIDYLRALRKPREATPAKTVAPGTSTNPAARAVKQSAAQRNAKERR